MKLLNAQNRHPTGIAFQSVSSLAGVCRNQLVKHDQVLALAALTAMLGLGAMAHAADFIRNGPGTQTGSGQFNPVNISGAGLASGTAASVVIGDGMVRLHVASAKTSP